MSLLSLDNNDIRIIGIWGMGGIGKTTIADAIFHQISYDEYGKCFIQNVRQRLEQCEGLVSALQQEVLFKILNDQNIKLDGVTLPQDIKRRLCQKKVFIVLDDVDDFLKIEELAAGLDQLGPGSRIIITTRRRDILHQCQVNDDYIYEVNGLSHKEAHKLFCEYAFRQRPPSEDLVKLSHKILRAINGNPLALKVAGSSLLRSNKLEWQSALSRLKKNPKILEVLRISYNGLEDEDKHTFLDIACFFVGEHEDYVAEILDNCIYSLKVLSDRSLITISNDKIIHMHDLLQEMDREIVLKESLNNPGSRSRLWTQEDVLNTLKNVDGTNAIRGIFLNMFKMNEEHLSSKVFKKMKNLRFLKFYDSTFDEYCYCSIPLGCGQYSSNVHFPNDINYLSNKLRSLNWLGYPLKALPSNFIPENLVELNLIHSNIEKLWEDNMHAPKLKYIVLKGCPYLSRVLDLLNAPLLEKIDIRSCARVLDLSSRNHFPSLNYLHLSRCINLAKISDLLDAPLLEKIDIDGCIYLLGFPPFAHPLNNLRELNMRNCYNFQSFPNNIRFPSLVSLCLSCCIKLARISDLLDAPLLEQIHLCHCKSLLNFPPPVHHYNNLRELNMRNCYNLQSFPNNICFPSLVCLDLSYCIKLARISDLLDTPLLEQIHLCHCKSLLNFPPPVHHYNNLRELNMRNCYNLQGFPNNIRFPSLEFLDLSCRIKPSRISYLLDAPLLMQTHLYNCKSLLYLPPPVHHFNNFCELKLSSMENLTKLVKLDLAECTRLKCISISISKLKALGELNLSNCYALECFPEILDTMESLKILDLSGTAIKGLHHSIENLSGLDMLFLRECKNLEMLPISIYNLTSLNILELSGCSKLENLPGNSVTDLSDYGESATAKPPICRFSKCSLYFTNCLNLNKAAVINILEFQINSYKDMTTKGSGTQAVDLKFFCPGSEVPGWFKGQTNGSSINIQVSGHDSVSGHLIRLVACAVIEFYDDENYVDIDISYWHRCHCKDDDSPWSDSIIVPYEDKTLIDSDHVALWYSDASVLELCGECTDYLFEFNLEGRPNCRVKYCGVCPIYEKHNITLPSIANETCGGPDQDFGAMSVKEQGKIRKFSDEAETSDRSNEDVIEPHPKSTQS